MKLTITGTLLWYDGPQLLKGFTLNDDAIAVGIEDDKWLVTTVSETAWMDYMEGYIDLRSLFTTQCKELFTGAFDGFEGEVTKITPFTGDPPDTWLPEAGYFH